MTFLERFKGKTDHLTREGIISTITNASIPINKTVEIVRTQSQVPLRKEKLAVSSPKVKEKQYRTNDIFDKKESLKPIRTNSTTMSMKPLRLKTSEDNHELTLLRYPTDSVLYDRRSNTGLLNHSYAPSPSNKGLINTYSLHKGTGSFGGLVNEFNSELLGPEKFNRIIQQGYGGEYSPKIKFNSMNNHYSSQNIKNFYEPSPTGSLSSKNWDEEMSESRLSRLSFVERQNQLISKYKAPQKPGDELMNKKKSSSINYQSEKGSRSLFN